MFRSFDLLVAAITCGIGLIGTGLGFAIVKTRSGRIASVVVGTSVALVGSLIVAPRATVAEMLIGAMMGLALISVWLWRSATDLRVRKIMQRPVVAGLGIAFSGAGLIAAGMWKYDQSESSFADEQMAHLLSIVGWHPPLEPAAIECRTDKGNPICVYSASSREMSEVVKEEEDVLEGFEWRKRIIPRSPATDESNCHGWVFTGGKYWVLGNDVAKILQENGYRATRWPLPGAATGAG